MVLSSQYSDLQAHSACQSAREASDAAAGNNKIWLRLRLCRLLHLPLNCWWIGGRAMKQRMDASESQTRHGELAQHKSGTRRQFMTCNPRGYHALTA